MTKRTWLLLAVGALLASLVVAWTWHARNAHATVAAGIPTRPKLDGWPAELEQRIEREEQAANAGSVSALVQLSRLYHANGFQSEAVHCYRNLIRVEPANPRWPHLLATLLGGYGMLDDALALEQRTTLLAPDYLPARLLLARAFLKENREPEARKIYEAALLNDGKNSGALHGLAMCDLAKDDWPAARDDLLRAIAARPQFEGALTLLVTVEEHLGNAVAAETARARAVAAGRTQDFPDPWNDELMADCYDSYRLSVAAAIAGAGGDGATAQRWLERTVALAPGQSWTHRLLGQLLDQLHDYPRADRELARALELDSTEPRNWSQLATLQLHEGRTEAAEQTMVAGETHCPTDGNLRYEHAAFLMETGNFDAAISELREAKRLQPSKGVAYFDLARIYIEMGRETEAIAELHSLLAIEPEHPLALLTLARHAVGSGDETQARAWLERVKRQPRVPADALSRFLTVYEKRFGHAPDDVSSKR